jgi:hypothetical protein
LETSFIVPRDIEEASLYPHVSRLLSDKGYFTFQKFPHGKYSPFEVDVLGFKKEINELYMVEVKLCHINKALRQGSMRLPYADYVSLGFPQAYAEWVYSKFRPAFEQKGFGLIAINGCAKELIFPRKSVRQKQIYKEFILRDIYKSLQQDMPT